MANGEAEWIKLSKLVNKVTRLIHRDSMFVDLMKKFLKFSIPFENEYAEKFVGTRTVDIMKECWALTF